MAENAPRQTNRFHQERARNRALFSSIGDGVIVTDENGNISEINSAATRILGFHAEELLGQWFPRVFRAFDDDGNELSLLDRPAIQAMVTGKPITGRIFYLTKSHQLVPVHVTVSPVLFHRRPVGVVEVFRDISKEYEVDRMKSEFISIASHQLRTPLTAIKTYSHMLAGGLGGELSSEQKDFMDIIIGSIDRMNELIDTLLDISKLEEGQLTITPQQTDLKELLASVIAELSTMADAKKIVIKQEYDSKKAIAQTDPLLVKEICANLLSNAIKYTPAAGTVTVRLKVTAKHFVLAMQDTGYGIPKADQVRIFTKFFRSENILDKETSGTGLGLYLVKKIAEGLGGDISFKSVEGEGSEFILKLPRKT